MPSKLICAFSRSVSMLTAFTFILYSFCAHSAAQPIASQPQAGFTPFPARTRLAHKEAIRQSRAAANDNKPAQQAIDSVQQAETQALMPESRRQPKWQQANGPETGTIVSLLAQGKTVLAGTSGGIFISHNGGRNWNYVEDGPDSFIYRVSAVANVLLAADPQARTASVWRSTNQGKSWEPANNGIPHGTAIFRIGTVGRTAVVYTGSGQLYRSTDQGLHWELTELPKPVPFPNFASLMSKRFFLAEAEADQNIVDSDHTSGTLLMGSDAGLLISDDDAQTWREAALNLPEGVHGVWPATIGNRLLVGTTGAGILISDDRGVSWQTSNQGLPDNAIITRLDSIKASLYLSTDNGDLYESRNQGATWELRNSGLSLNLGITNIIAMGDEILLGTYDGVLRSNDHGQSWRRSNAGLRAGEVYDQETIGRHWFVGSWGGGVWRSSNQGKSWTQINNGITPTPNFGIQAGMLLADGHTLYLGTDTKLFRSDDLGESWQEIPNAIPEGNGTYFGNKLGNDLYIGLFGGVIVSKDHGKSFHLVEGLPADQPFDDFLQVGNIIYACSYGGGIFRSDDGGEKWQAINDGLEAEGAQFINGITMFHNSLLIGTDAATIYRSDNYGYYWYPVGIGNIAPSLGVNDVKSFGGKLYASTYGVGVLVSNDEGLTWERFNDGLVGKRLFNFQRVGDKIAINSSGHSVSLLPIWRE